MLSAQGALALGLAVEEGDTKALLLLESALEWLKAHTTLPFTVEDIESLKGLPAGAKVFVRTYREALENPVGVTGESLGGMSQSFDTGGREHLLHQLARQLLEEHLCSQVTFFQAGEQWQYGG